MDTPFYYICEHFFSRQTFVLHNDTLQSNISMNMRSFVVPQFMTTLTLLIFLLSITATLVSLIYYILKFSYSVIAPQM
jgi:hypothetical protein